MQTRGDLGSRPCWPGGRGRFEACVWHQLARHIADSRCRRHYSDFYRSRNNRINSNYFNILSHNLCTAFNAASLTVYQVLRGSIVPWGRVASARAVANRWIQDQAMSSRNGYWRELWLVLHPVAIRYAVVALAIGIIIVGYFLLTLDEARGAHLPARFDSVSFLLLATGVLSCLASVIHLSVRLATPATSSAEDGHPLSDPVLGLARPFRTDDSNDEAALRVEQGRRIGEQVGAMMAINLANALLVTGIIYQQVETYLLLSWLIVVTGLAIAGMVRGYRKRGQPQVTAVSKRFLRRVSLHAGVRGLVWGSCFALFFGDVNATGQLVLMSVSLGMLAGGVPALALIPSAALLYGLGVTIPTLLRLVSLEGGVYFVLALFAIVFTASMVTIGCQLYRNFADNFLAQRAQREQAATISLLLNEFENSASDWLWETDAEGRLTRLPGRMLHVFGVVAGAMDTTTMNDLLTRAKGDGAESIDRYLKDKAAFREAIVETVDADGQTRWVALTASPKDKGGFRGVGSDITLKTIAQRDAIVALERANRAELRLKDGIDALGVGFVLSDADDCTIVANKTFASLFPASTLSGGATSFDEIMKTQATLWHPQRPYISQTWLDDLISKRRGCSEPFDICLPNNIWLRVEGRPTSEAGTVTVLTDITDIKRKEAELALQSQRLATSNQDLQQFAAVASHDLQEPLRKIEAFGSRLTARSGDLLDDEGKAYLDRMTVATKRMRRLITDLLAFSRAAKADAPTEVVDLNVLVGDVLDDLSIAVEERGAMVDVGPLGAVRGNYTQMRQLMQNLLSNSLKFVNSGVTPRIRVERREGEAGKFELRLKDNGIGFDMKNHDKIFEIFQRLHGRDSYEGTGIGLATCRKIVERHGGTIRAESAPGLGTEFIISLPILNETKTSKHHADAA